jgi:hypothetical protein
MSKKKGSKEKKVKQKENIDVKMQKRLSYAERSNFMVTT